MAQSESKVIHDSVVKGTGPSGVNLTHVQKCIELSQAIKALNEARANVHTGPVVAERIETTLLTALIFAASELDDAIPPIPEA